MRLGAVLVAMGIFLSACGGAQIPSSSRPTESIVRIPSDAKSAGAFLNGYTISGLSFQLLRGSDGNVWFPEGMGTRSGGIGRLTPDGALTEWPMPLAGLTRTGTLAPDGSIWFCLAQTISGGYLASITPSGVITLHSLPTRAPRFVTVGSDGNLWYTDDSNVIGRYNRDGSVALFSVPTPNSGLRGITLGPDGNLWFIETFANQIGKLTTDGQFAEYAVPSAAGSIAVIDGRMWFQPASGNYFGRITAGGHYSQVALPGYPGGMTKGPDGKVWFSLQDTNAIGSMTPDGQQLRTYTVPVANVNPVGALFGSDGNFYFTEPLGAQPAIGIFRP